jgi:GNAT superfamily N-acetyltransferase
MKEVMLRKAKAGDYEALCSLFDEVDRLHREKLPWLFQQPERSIREQEYVLGLMQDENVLLLVAEADGNLVGLAHAFVRDNPPLPVFTPRRYAVIDSIVVTQSMQNRGIGKQLANEVDEWVKAQGASSIELNVYEFNEEARQFYAALGYSTISRKMGKPLR